MPSIATKKQGAAALSWDTFPEPPPEAANWKPDPDFIAKPGVMKDSRFNKDPQAEQRRSAMKREMRIRGTTTNFDDDSRSSSPSVSSTAQPPSPPAMAKWPAQTIRSSYPTALASVRASPISVAAGSAPASSEAPAPFIPPRERALIVPARAQVTSTVKGTMENFPVMPMEYKRRSPAASSGQPRSGSPATNGIPAWAGPLEKLLAEGIANERSTSVQRPPISTPPHKRKMVNGINGTAALSHLDTDATRPAKSTHDIDLEAQFMAANEASRRVSGKTTSDTAVSKDDTDMRLSAQYQRSLDIALIKFMESELDLGSHGTKSQLSAMDAQAFKLYFEKVRIAHRQLWIAEKVGKPATITGA